MSRSGLALARQLIARGGDDFLVTGQALDSFGFDARAKSGLAVQQRVAGFEVTASAESGAARLWDRDTLLALRRGWREHGYDALSLSASRSLGPFFMSARATRLAERETVLGALFDGALAANGTHSWFADLEAQWTPAAHWSLSAAWRQGWTRLGAGGVRPTADHLRSTAWSFDATRWSLLCPDDRLSLRIAQPLRVSHGGLDLKLPVSYDYASLQTGFATERLNLAPTGRERDIEAAYARPLWGGQLSANAYWRHEPGNFAAAPEDLGAAIRFSFGI